MLTRLLACSLVLLLPATAVAEGDALCTSLSDLFNAEQPYQQYASLNQVQLQSLADALGQSKCTQYSDDYVLCSTKFEQTSDYSVAIGWAEQLQETSDAFVARLEACQSFEGWRAQEVKKPSSPTYPFTTKTWVHHGRDLEMTLSHGIGRHGMKRSAYYTGSYEIVFDVKEP